MPLNRCQWLIWTAWLFLATDKRRPLIAGLLIGVAALLRETALILPLLAIPIAVWFDRRIAKQLLITFVAAYMFTVPWQIRNASLPGGTYALSDGRLGFNLWIGTWERNGDWYLAGLDAANYPENAFRSSEERTRLMAAYWAGNDRPFRDVALDRWQTDPRGTAAAWVTRYPRLWMGTRTDQIEFRAARGSTFWTALKSGLWVLNSLMLFAGFVGFLLAASRRSSQLVFALPIASLAALYLPFHNVETRYSLPALPFVYLFVAYLIVCWRMAPIKQEQESSSATL